MTHKTSFTWMAAACLALACSLATASPVFLQDFDGTRFPPISWSVTNTAGTSVSWYLNSYWNDVNYTGSSGTSAMISSTGAPRLVYNCTLTSTFIQLPAAAAALELRFNNVLETWSGDETADVDFSSDLGVTWNNIFRWKNVDHLEGQQAFSVLPYLGKYVKVRFHYYNTISQAWDMYWQIDDVRVVVPVDGDANKDDSVDVVDLLTLVATFGLVQGDNGFDATCDFNSDGSVDVVDLLTMVYNFGLSS